METEPAVEKWKTIPESSKGPKRLADEMGFFMRGGAVESGEVMEDAVQDLRLNSDESERRQQDVTYKAERGLAPSLHPYQFAVNQLEDCSTSHRSFP